ncbi:ferredoxin--NADP reductase [Williamsia sp. DF01-3]|uniref:ferredoxin--NADP reductase n=1 Tax=Williamsia sp. DF01-3 TaxID=2934157 RepID=UPI001FF45DB3|nr:ferredoxin--NADP reductase [Williamsia sp. DF01-3]MCK0516699.1 ferredoxin--NADP reductase [Williamsia sp. DF01-3]
MEEPGSAVNGSVALTVREVITETPDAKTIVFDHPGDGLRYRPGQFLTLRIPSERTGSVARCYSLSSAPGHDDALRVTVKRTVDGYGSNWLCDNVAAGHVIESLVSAGAFTPKDLDRDLLLVGAGSGITPLLSIVKTALFDGTGRVVLFYANRDPASVIFAATLRELFAEHPDRLTILHWLENVQGLPTTAALQSMLQPYDGFEAFICGPKPFMRGARLALEQIGLPRGQIHIENFVSLSEDPFTQPATIVTARGDEDEADSAGVTVLLDGVTHEFDWPRSKTLIDVLLERGVDAPYSCREGECGSCQATVLSGQIEMTSVGALDEEDIADGLILGCQARPVSDQVSIEF